MARLPTITLENDDVVSLPYTWQICNKCRGNGQHSCRLGAMTHEYMNEQGPEFIEDYLNGEYDSTCEDCDGSGKVAVADVKAMSKENRKLWRAQERDLEQLRADERSEYMMSADYLGDLRSGM